LRRQRDRLATALLERLFALSKVFCRGQEQQTIMARQCSIFAV